MALAIFKNQNYEVTAVTYTKASGEESDRDIVVMSEPVDQYKVLDVTDMTEEQRTQLRALLLSHKEALATFLASVPTEDKRPRWKNFNPAGLTFKNSEAA